MDKLSYSFGLAIGTQLMDMGAEAINVEDFSQALKDVFTGQPLAVKPEEAQNMVSSFLHEQEIAKRKEMEEKGLKARSEGESFLRDNGKRPGIITTASGLQYEILEEGNGKHPKATDSVKCHYEGRLIDGTVFDSSIRRGEPAVFPLNGVISGWTEGVQLMAEGAKYRFYIPYQLAYGANGAGSSIPPYAALIFDIELIAVM
ncbi:MAG: FKBP-type peptidyl-prolyl cis-trans isomerase [Prevotellaceae bacterium]|nr:FKBP-type peptidyl-prolyl cis-trans isomerase [Prevotellaceae bacterium]MDD7108175.1 FKBP-type peptidyl-prolyl cis-trans isomerase [Prevotellaceae bacterium]MDY3294627.1 FKBP-type peptidyl-prolyl cis-trans isomerase [Bacteroidaceae bacterium]